MDEIGMDGIGLQWNGRTGEDGKGNAGSGLERNG